MSALRTTEHAASPQGGSFASHLTPADHAATPLGGSFGTNLTYLTVQGPPADGEQGLLEVAKLDGQWNWALVAAEPGTLPLLAGGVGGIEEMQGSLEGHGRCFGLLHLEFDAGVNGTSVQMIFVDFNPDPATRQSRSQNLSSSRRRKIEEQQQEVADGMEAAMVKSLQSRRHAVGSITARVVIGSREECTAEYLVDTILKDRPGLGFEGVGLESLRAAAETKKERAERSGRSPTSVQPARPSERVLASTGADGEAGLSFVSEVDDTLGFQRSKVKLFTVGTPVEIKSVDMDKWVLDGEVVEVAKDSFWEKGHQIRAGSTKIVYSKGARHKWVPPHQLHEMVRESARPRRPETVLVHASMETSGWFNTYMRPVFCKVEGGVFGWWDSKQDYHVERPEGQMLLMDLTLQEQGSTITVRSPSTKGSTYKLQSDATHDLAQLVQALRTHAKFCAEERVYFVNAGSQVPGEALRF